MPRVALGAVRHFSFPALSRAQWQNGFAVVEPHFKIE
jgi:hypothetical protein